MNILDGINMENQKNKELEKVQITVLNSTISKCEFEACRLANSNFEKSKFVDSNIVRSIFDGGSIKKSKIIGLTLEECGLWNLEMEECTFEEVKVESLDIVGVVLKNNCFKTQEMDTVFFNGSDLENNDFTNSSLPVLTIRRSKFLHDNFMLSMVDDGEIEYSVFDNCNIENAECKNSYFKGCTFKNMDFRKAKFTDVEFIQCTFEDCLYTEEQAVLFGLA